TIERSDDGGAHWAAKTSGINGNDPAEFIVPYIMDPATSSRLILGTNHIYETTDKGDNWTAIGTPGVNGFNPDNYVVSAVGVNGSTIYAATVEPKVFVTVNDGVSWSDVSVGGFQIYFDMTVDPNNSQHALLAGYYFNGGAVYETKNGGATWTDVTGNLGNVPTQAVAIDPSTGVVYIGTDVGVFAASTPGTWARFGTGLPTVMVDSLDVNSNLGLLGAGTFGRGLWVTSLTGSFQTPGVSSLSPSSAAAGGAAFTLTVNGSNFQNGALVQWGDSGLATTFVSASQLTASVPASLLAAPGTVAVGVTNPGGQMSSTLTFTITPGTPTLSSLSPSTVDAGGPAFTLTIKGRNYVNSATVNWNGSALTTTFVSATQLKAIVPSSLTASPGSASVTVTTPGGGTSSPKTIKILETTVPAISAHLTRNSTTGVYTAVITLKNTGFLSASSLEITASSLGAARTSTALPLNLGSLGAGATTQASLTYPASAGTTGSTVTLKVTAKFSGGSTATSLRVRLP
ncbi:MAG TPA: IPT/TIG domain-containing protein, partial [Chthonomonadaceae bacterium]|nr:IPT/TIG domain-containing protein [Chthonomonadaceae bacterium]